MIANHSAGFLRSTLIVATVLFSIGWSDATRVAKAGPRRGLPGSSCVPYHAAEANDFERENGILFNTSMTASREVICPLPVDIIEGENTLAVDIVVDNSTPTEKLSCTVHSMGDGGNDLRSNAFTQEPLRTKMHIEVRPAIVEERRFWVWCRLPPLSQIYRMTWTTF